MSSWSDHQRSERWHALCQRWTLRKQGHTWRWWPPFEWLDPAPAERRAARLLRYWWSTRAGRHVH